MRGREPSRQDPTRLPRVIDDRRRSSSDLLYGGADVVLGQVCGGSLSSSEQSGPCGGGGGSMAISTAMRPAALRSPALGRRVKGPRLLVG